MSATIEKNYHEEFNLAETLKLPEIKYLPSLNLTPEEANDTRRYIS